jgi:hypothetical protein
MGMYLLFEDILSWFLRGLSGLKNPENILSLDSKSVGGMILAAMLVNPEDGKPANYVVEPFITPKGDKKHRLIGIDNDHAFVPAIVRETPEKTFMGKTIPTIQVKTILFCLDHMTQPLDPEITTRIINQKVDTFLLPWLREWRHVHRSLTDLVNDKKYLSLFK